MRSSCVFVSSLAVAYASMYGGGGDSSPAQRAGDPFGDDPYGSVPADDVPVQGEPPQAEPMQAELMQGGSGDWPGATTEANSDISIIWRKKTQDSEPTQLNPVKSYQEVNGADSQGECVTHKVVVGGEAGLVYAPEEIQAAPCDIVEFDFMAQNHTVTQSGFDAPCGPIEGGMKTGFLPNPDNVTPPPQVAMQVMVTTPLWFYCGQGNHCGQGMVFSINPTAEKSHAAFKEKAVAQGGGGGGAAPGGGDPYGGPSPVAGSPGLKPEEQCDPKPGAAPGAPEAPVADGSPEAPPAGWSPDAPPPSFPVGTPSVMPGLGSVNPDGSCSCFVTVELMNNSPLPGQGANHWGGYQGAIPKGAYQQGAISQGSMGENYK